MPDFLNPSALEPLFAPWEEPHSHRVRAEKEGEPAKSVKGRRPSPIVIAQNIRGDVREWRAAFYAGASDTTRHLLDHWFNRSHRRTTPAGEDFCCWSAETCNEAGSGLSGVLKPLLIL